MALFSKLFKSDRKHGQQTATTPVCIDKPVSLKDMKIKAKLLLPLVSLPDTQPAMALFRAGGYNKRKRRPTVTMTLCQNGICLRSQQDWAITENGDVLLTLPYEKITEVATTDRKNEVAIICQTPNDYYWCAFLKLKVVKTKSFSWGRKITGMAVQQLIQAIQKGDISREALSEEPSSLVSASDSFFYIDCSTDAPQPEQEHKAAKDNVSLVSIILYPRSASCPNIHFTTSYPTEEEKCSLTAEQEENGIDYNKLFYQHSDCCIDPCDVTCPMFPDESLVQARNEQIKQQTLLTPPVFYSPQWEQPSLSYAYYWDANTGSYQLLPTQPHPYTTVGATDYYSPDYEQYGNTPNTCYPFTDSQLSNITAGNVHSYCNSYLAYLYDLLASYTTPLSNMLMRDNRRRKMLQEVTKIEEQIQQVVAAYNKYVTSTQQAYTPYQQSSAFQQYSQPGVSQPFGSPSCMYGAAHYHGNTVYQPVAGVQYSVSTTENTQPAHNHYLSTVQSAHQFSSQPSHNTYIYGNDQLGQPTAQPSNAKAPSNYPLSANSQHMPSPQPSNASEQYSAYQEFQWNQRIEDMFCNLGI